MEKKFNYVYITTNLINGKQYVGDRSCNCDPTQDDYLGSGRPTFRNSLKYHGKENFKKEILEFFLTKKEAFNAQEKYIIQYNTLVPGGYNISPKGGNNCSGGISKDGCERISKSKKGKKFSEKHCKHISEGKRGIKHTEEHNKHIGESGKGRIFSKQHRKNLSECAKRQKGKRILSIKRYVCPHCSKIFSAWGLSRHNKKIINNINKL
jgi:hypothetical protein